MIIKTVAEAWDALEKCVADKSDAEVAKRIRAAFDDYYSEVYGDGDLIYWIANLYDPAIGGFYYSESGRDNDGFLPDLESTRQAISWIRTMGTPEIFGDYKDIYPEWMQKQVIRFVKERQDKNGYFYHPQWPRELTDSKPHRRGRDLNWACQLREWFGDAPTYDTPNGVRGNGLLWDGTPACDFEPRDDGDVVSVPKEELVTPHLKDKESFEKYLDGLLVEYTSWYPLGNRLEAEGVQISMRDKKLREMGADYSLCDILANWLNSHQHAETGLWDNGEISNSTICGLLKVSGAYNNIQRPIPNAEQGIKSAIALMNTDYEPDSVCSVLNPWYAVNNLLSNIRHYGNGSSEEGARIEAEYRKYVFEHAPEMIKATKKRILRFKKPYGAFSFAPDYSSNLSQGHPVAVWKSFEGDVNATSISTASVIGHIIILLGVERVPVFTVADKMRFLNIIEEKNQKAGV